MHVRVIFLQLKNWKYTYQQPGNLLGMHYVAWKFSRPSSEGVKGHAKILRVYCLWRSILTTSVIQHICPPSPDEESHCSACVLLFCQLDYCKSLLIDINCDQMYRLQKVENHAAKVVFHKSRHEHARPLLKALHWLPVKNRIIFKIATFVFSVSLIVPVVVSLGILCNAMYTLRSSSDEKNSFLCKLEALGLWSPIIFCSDSPCLEEPSSSHPTLQFSLTIQNFS